jgi:2'-5' RNA ligase
MNDFVPMNEDDLYLECPAERPSECSAVRLAERAIEHAALRARFLACGRTIENVRRDFPEWHKGRARYLLWAIDVDCAGVRAQVASASAHLADLLLADYRRQPHITLALCGFPGTAPQLSDEITLVQIEAQIAALRLARIAPFAIDIGVLSSFSSAPFLHAESDPAGCGMGALRACLAEPAASLDYPVPDYTAHVTVGLYNGAWPSAPVGLRLAAFPADTVTRCIVDRVQLMSYACDDIGGPLTTHATCHLDGGATVWHLPFPS